MKKYFAKYLPVEGAIKEGNVFIDNNGNYDVCHAGDKIESTDKKVKLFLCSIDIQIGDKVKWLGNLNDPEEIVKDEFGPYHWQTEKGVDKKERFFKIIGEISQQAVWVKPGDEFDEEDFKLVIEGNSGVRVPFDNGELLKLPNWKLVIVILCPTCKSIH